MTKPYVAIQKLSRVQMGERADSLQAAAASADALGKRLLAAAEMLVEETSAAAHKIRQIRIDLISSESLARHNCAQVRIWAIDANSQRPRADMEHCLIVGEGHAQAAQKHLHMIYIALTQWAASQVGEVGDLYSAPPLDNQVF